MKAHAVMYRSGNEIVCKCGALLTNNSGPKTLAYVFAEHIRQERKIEASQ